MISVRKTISKESHQRKKSSTKVFSYRKLSVVTFQIENLSSTMIPLYRKLTNDDLVLKKSHQRQFPHIERLSKMLFSHRQFINHDFVLKKSHHS